MPTQTNTSDYHSHLSASSTLIKVASDPVTAITIANKFHCTCFQHFGCLIQKFILLIS
jgi:hypothetical protein